MYWPPRALLTVALKTTSDTWAKANPELAAARIVQRKTARAAAKAKVHKKRGQPNPKGRPKGKAKIVTQAESKAPVPEGGDIEELMNRVGHMSVDASKSTRICLYKLTEQHDFRRRK
jgi:hypothetical protein